MSSTRPANHHRARPAADSAGQPLNRVFERHTVLSHVQIRTIVAGGMPGWQITLIAVGAALLAAALAVLADRAVAARRRAVAAATA